MVEIRPGAEKRVAQLLDAAFEVFSKSGYNGTKMEDIATCAGVAKGTVYQYFKSKESLFLALCDMFTKKMMHGIESIPDQSFEGVYHALLEVLEQEKDFFALMMEFWAYGNHVGITKAFTNMYDEARLILARIFKAQQDLGIIKPHLDTEALACAIIALFDGFFVQDAFSPKNYVKNNALSFLKVMQVGIME